MLKAGFCFRKNTYIALYVDILFAYMYRCNLLKLTISTLRDVDHMPQTMLGTRLKLSVLRFQRCALTNSRLVLRDSS